MRVKVLVKTCAERVDAQRDRSLSNLPRHYSIKSLHRHPQCHSIIVDIFVDMSVKQSCSEIL